MGVGVGTNCCKDLGAAPVTSLAQLFCGVGSHVLRHVCIADNAYQMICGLRVSRLRQGCDYSFPGAVLMAEGVLSYLSGQVAECVGPSHRVRSGKNLHCVRLVEIVELISCGQMG
ncbi:hypothetical protein ACWEBX_41340 [Streptomyces sp. NPDC005070]